MATLVVPENNPSPVEDAEILRKACKGWGTDEKAIISVLGHRNAFQRKQIRQTYEELYQEDLIKQLESELSGDFEKAIYRWILDPADRDAVLANVALKNAKPNYRVIVEISCVHSPNELLEVKRAYHSRYKHSLEEDVASHTKGDLRKLLFALVGTYKYDGNEIDSRLAASEAKILHEMIRGKSFGHEDVIRIMGTRSRAQLIATFNCFKDQQSTSITKSIVGDPDDAFLEALRVATRCIYAPQKYFGKVLQNAINKVGTDEDALTRVIVTRAEKDLKDIKEMYHKRSTVTLDHAVAKETSGDYQAFLLTLLGSEGH
ncbi:annexin-like protein RJ4 [Telopea speciosissima]|uniref:annexin-like protein RJ4 n=1 Tax=Telopea speciosissima TaxID=54955 RepID=UPI001CC5F63D|nr:annexin-like protein RJ4 [Telopea speciosissima]